MDRVVTKPRSACGVMTTVEFSLNNVLPQPPADGIQYASTNTFPGQIALAHDDAG